MADKDDTEWKDGYPVWFDDVGRVELLMSDGTKVIGEFQVEDETYDGDVIFGFTPDGGNVYDVAYTKAVKFRSLEEKATPTEDRAAILISLLGLDSINSRTPKIVSTFQVPDVEEMGRKIAENPARFAELMSAALSMGMNGKANPIKMAEALGQEFGVRWESSSTKFD